MSDSTKQVDERVLSMKFDNQKFEQNVRTTMSTLDKLKQSLKFDNHSKGLEDINSQVKSFDVTPMANGLNTVKLTLGEIAKITVFQDIIRSAEAAGKKLVNTFSVEPIHTGFQEYELKMGSVQTIMSSTGERLQTVNKYLEELNEYSDKTIYSFSDMTNNIGKFTNAGVKLEDAVAAIKGVSNEAAVSGANANEASRAMYNFAQALSAGYVKLIDWKSIENANMATVEFKNELLKTALELGTVVRNGDRYVTTTTNMQGKVSELFDATHGFNDALANQWMTTDVLTKTLAKYADETTEIGKKAYASAQDVKTFSMMMDTLKEAAQSGWAQTWELFIGDFEEAKEVWTKLATTFGDLIDKSAKARNNLLSGILDSKWEKLTKKINEAGIETDEFEKRLKKVVKSHGHSVKKMTKEHGSLVQAFRNGALSVDYIKEALYGFESVQMKTGEATDDLTGQLEHFQKVVSKVWNGDYGNGEDRIKSLTEAGYKYREVQDLVNKTVGGRVLTTEDLLETIKNLSVEEIKSNGYTTEQIETITELKSAIDGSVISIDDLLEDITQKSGRELIFDSIANTVEAVRIALDAVNEAYHEVFPPIDTDRVYGALVAIESFTEKLKLSDDDLDDFEDTVKGVFSALDLFRMLLGTGLQFVLTVVGSLIGKTDLNLLDLTGTVGRAITEFRNWVKENDAIVKGVKLLGEGVALIIKKIGDLFVKLYELEPVKTRVDKLAETFEGFFDNFGDGLDAAIAFVDKLKAMDNISLESIKDALKEVGVDVDNIAENMIQGLVNGIKDGIPKAVTAIVEIGKSMIKGFADTFSIHSPSRVMYDFGIFIGQGLINAITFIFSSVVGAFKSLGQGCLEAIEQTDFSEAFKSIGEKIFDGISKIDWDEAFSKFISIGAIILIKDVIGIAKSIVSPLESMSGLLKSASKNLEKFTDSISSGIKRVTKAASFKMRTEGIRNIAISIGILAASIWLLTKTIKENPVESAVAFAAVGAFLIGIVVLMERMSQVSKSAGSNSDILKIASLILGLGISIRLMAKALKTLSSIDEHQLQTVILFGIIAGTLVLTMKGIGKLVELDKSGSINKAVKVVTKIGTCFLLMAVALKIISTMDSGTIGNSLVVIGGFTSLIIGLVALSTFAGENADKAGKMMLMFAGSLLILTAVMKSIGKMKGTTILKGLYVMTCLMTFVTALVLLSNYAGENATKAGLMLVGVSVALLMITKVIKNIGKLSVGSITKGLITLGFLELFIGVLISITESAGDKVVQTGIFLMTVASAILILSASIKMLSTIRADKLFVATAAVALISKVLNSLIQATKQAQKCKTTLLLLAGVVLSLSLMVLMLSNIDPMKLLPATAAVVSIMGMLALLVKATGSAKTCTAAMISIMAVMGMLWLMIMTLSTLPANDVLAISASLSILMLSIGSSLAIMGFAGNNATAAIPALAAVTIAISVLALILGIITGLNVAPSLETAEALSLMLLAMSAVCVILAGVGAVAGAAIAGAAAFDAVVAIIGGLMVGIGALVTYIPEVEQFLDKGIDVLQKVGIGIGEFFGGIVSGAMTTISEGLPTFADNLSDFMTKLQPFLNGVSQIDESVISGVTSLAGMIIVLTAAELIQGLTGFLTGGLLGSNTLSKFAEELVPFGESFRKFADKMDGINPDAVVAASKAAESIGAFAKSLPKHGGKLQEWIGDNSLTSFAEELDAFATPFVRYSKKMANVNTEAVEKSSAAAQALNDFASGVPKHGGIISDWLGDNSLKMYAEELEAFAEPFVMYSRVMAGVNVKAISNSTEAAKALNDFANGVPKHGGKIKEWITGDNTLKAFAEELEAFAEPFVNYSKDMLDVETEAVNKSSAAGMAITNFVDYLPDKDSAFAKVFGGQMSLTDLAEELKAFGKPFKKYSEYMQCVDANVVTTTTNAAKAIVELKDQLSDVDTGWFGDNTNLSNFGSDLVSFGDFFAAYYAKIQNIGPNQLGDVITQLRRIVDVAFDMQEINTNGMTNFGQSLEELGARGVDAFCEAFKSPDSQITTAMLEFVAKFTEKVSTMEDTLSGKMTKIADTIADALRKKYSDFRDIGTIYVLKMAQGMMSETNKSGNIMDPVTSSMVSSVRGKFVDFYNAGKFLVTGFVKGIENNVYKAVDAATALSDATAKATDEALDIHSPSRRAYRSGSFYGQGFVNSIKDSCKAATEASTEMAESAHEGLSSAIRKISDWFDADVDLNPTIRPIVDMSEAEAGSRRLRDLYSNMQFAGLGINLSANTRTMSSVNNSMDAINQQKLQNASNSRVVSAIGALTDEIRNMDSTTYNVNGITYDDGSNVQNAVRDLIDATRINRRV